MFGAGSRPQTKWLVILASALGIALGGGAASYAQDRTLADQIRTDDPARCPHKPMYGPQPWTPLDRQGFAISMELSAKLRELGKVPGQMPGITLLELSQYGAAAMLYRIPWIASHTNVDRVLQKTAPFIPNDVSRGSVALFVGRDGLRALAVDVIYYRPRYPDKIEAAQVFFAGPDRIETLAPVLPGTAWLGLFFVTPDALKTEAAKKATRIVVKISGRPIFDVALDGDLARREAFFEAWETAVAKYQALLPPTEAVDCGEPTAEDMAEALLNNPEILLSEFIEWSRNPTRAARCGLDIARQNDPIEVLRKCVKIQKIRCVASARGHTCDYVAILGIDGLERAEKPGRGRFYRNENNKWLVSEIRPGNP